MKIKNINIDSPLFLAPMADYTNVAFRRICKECGAGFTVTEMVSAKALFYESEKTYDLLETYEEEHPMAVQIFGSDPKIMAYVCTLPILEKFDIIDINMGCPAPKIVKNGEGSALMQNIKLAREIITECVKLSKKPITVKFRAGWDEKNINAVEFAKMCEEAGASAITIHGRTRDQFYSGKVNYDIIKKVKQSVNIPVIGNGDVVDKLTYQKMLDTGVDAVMIGRASVGNPWIFSELLNIPYKKDKLEVLLKYIKYMEESKKAEREIILSMRKVIIKYLVGIPNSSEEKQYFLTLESLNEVILFLKRVFT